jgi:hypothetical protein
METNKVKYLARLMKSAVYPYMKLFELCPFPIACEKTNLFSPNLILSVSGFSPAMIGIIL